jgi:aminoglycoside phosphotransferase (APT) family kinase protein
MRSSPATEVPGVNVAALTRYLPAVLDDYDPQSELTARLLAGGRSNMTCLLSQPGGTPSCFGLAPKRHRPARHGFQRHGCCARPPPGVSPSAHDMAREFRALSGLAGTDFPAPRPRALCTDPSVLGVTFLIYDYVPGLIIADEAAARRLTPAQAGQLCGELAGTLARLHACFWDDPSLPWASLQRRGLPRSLGHPRTDQWRRTAARAGSFGPARAGDDQQPPH